MDLSIFQNHVYRYQQSDQSFHSKMQLYATATKSSSYDKKKGEKVAFRLLHSAGQNQPEDAYRVALPFSAPPSAPTES